MQYTRICLTGANGSGKTTLGRALCEALHLKHMDIEDYYFEPSSNPYAKPRLREEALRLLRNDIEAYPRFLVSAVNGDLGSEANSLYECVIFIDAPEEIRLSRVRSRSEAHFGDRVRPGGDMHEQEEAFYRFVKSRTLEQTEAWLKTLSCPVFRVSNAGSFQKAFDEILSILKTAAQ